MDVAGSEDRGLLGLLEATRSLEFLTFVEEKTESATMQVTLFFILRNLRRPK